MIRLGSTWTPRRRTRGHRRVCVVVREPGRDGRLRYRFELPVRTSVTMFTRPYVSTRSESVERFVARFREVRR